MRPARGAKGPMSMCVCVYMYLSDEWERIDKRAGLVRPSYVRDANDTPALNSGSAAQAEGLYNIYIYIYVYIYI